MKKRVDFFLLFEFPRESSRDHRGDFPVDLDPGVRAKGEPRLPPKNPSRRSAHAPSRIIS